MSLRLRVARLIFNDGTAIDVPESGVVVIVGPNNAGKSATLREIAGWAVTNPWHLNNVVLDELTLVRDGNGDDLVAWLEDNAFAFERDGSRFFRALYGGETLVRALQYEWDSPDRSHQHPETGEASPTRAFLPTVQQHLVTLAAAEQRLTLIGSSPPHNPVSDVPSNPLQVVFMREDLERELSDLSRVAFDRPLTLSRVIGGELTLYVGTPSTPPTVVPDPAYLAELNALPKLQEQGDGMRSFMGLLLMLKASNYQVVLVDEPEAFLHPPQAKLIGRRLAGDALKRQVFVATHDVNVVQGALEEEGGSVTILRLRRDGERNHASVLAAADVRELWRDPLLRFSNTLEGLFHRGVVVCEADTDARFYSAVLDARITEQGLPAHDLLFTQSGGKERLKTVILALQAVEVPVAAIADFDVLRDESSFEAIIEALGGDPLLVAKDTRIVRSAVAAIGQAPPRLAVQAEINKLLDANEASGVLTRDDAAAVRRTLKLNDGWAVVKRGGLKAIPSGDAYEASERVLDYIADIGLFVVPVGELERWVPAVGHHGSKWIIEVIERGLHRTPPTDALAFIQTVEAWFGRAK